MDIAGCYLHLLLLLSKGTLTHIIDRIRPNVTRGFFEIVIASSKGNCE
jgi:hypothetical protein